MNEFAKLSILSNELYIKKARDFLEILLEEYDFDESDVKLICMALEKALLRIASKSISEGELQFIDLSFLDTKETFEISILNKGIPFEPKISDAEDALDSRDEKFNSQLIRKIMDNVIYKNKGLSGQEIRLIKNLERRSVFQDIVESTEKKPVPENLELKFRHIKPEEVLEITRCIYDEYKYTYISEDIYYPERINRMIKGGIINSYVAITDDGEVAAHTAMQKNYAYPALLDTSVWVVKQKYRAHKIMKKLLPYSLEKAKEMDINGVYVEAVMHHPATQKISQKHDFHSTGFLLGYTPATTEVNYDATKGRRSLALGYKAIKDIPEVELYMPPVHEDYITRVYNNIGTVVAVNRTPGVLQLCQQTEFTVNQNAYRNVAEIDIDNCGEDFDAAILEEKKQLKLENFSAILLRINMESPDCVYIYEKALESRFFFTGILPHTGRGNFILMQNILGNGVDYDNLMTIDDYTESLNYIRKFDPDEFIEKKDPNKEQMMNIQIDNTACPV